MAHKPRPGLENPHEGELAARAAWLHFVGGLTQAQVAKRLKVPTTRAHRYIARAQHDGLVRVFVDAKAADCVELETALIERYGLADCHIAMEVPETGNLPLRALAPLGARFLMQAIDGGTHRVIGVGNGRTLSASVEAMGRCDAGGVRFVSVLGGLTRSYAANPFDVIHRLVQKTAAEAYMLPAPLYVNSAQDKAVMMAQHGIRAAMELIDAATLFIIGIGDTAQGSGGLAAATLDGTDALKQLRDQGAVAEILGQFLDADGQMLASIYDRRVMAPPLERLRGCEVVAIAGGFQKTTAIKAALKSGLLRGLITDEATARAIVGTKADATSTAFHEQRVGG